VSGTHAGMASHTDREILGIGALVDSAEAVLVDKNGEPWPIGQLVPEFSGTKITDFIRARREMRPVCTAALGRALSESGSREMEVPLGPPVGPTSKIICTIDNYADHAEEFSTEIFPRPIFFLKPFSSLIGNRGTVRLPRAARRVDYEVELAVVIGDQCRAVSPTEAMDVVAGYCIFLDMSARDFRSIPYTWFGMKAWDTFGPVGPYIVEAVEIRDPLSLEISLVVNGETRMNGNTGQMVFSPFDLISAASEVVTLSPGDIIATGTIAGVGPAGDGDIVEAAIEGIGTLSVTVVASDVETRWHDGAFPDLYAEYNSRITGDSGADDPIAP
jgi:2-keto-4-pentenoate hydratase/2-oxohepta-3-ene-1,7-dioic acid hydratase in catechol pathway